MDAERRHRAEARGTRTAPASVLNGCLFAIISLLILLLPSLVKAQSTYGAVAGSVTDPSGAAIVEPKLF